MHEVEFVGGQLDGVIKKMNELATWYKVPICPRLQWDEKTKMAFLSNRGKLDYHVYELKEEQKGVFVYVLEGIEQ